MNSAKRITENATKLIEIVTKMLEETIDIDVNRINIYFEIKKKLCITFPYII